MHSIARPLIDPIAEPIPRALYYPGKAARAELPSGYLSAFYGSGLLDGYYVQDRINRGTVRHNQPGRYLDFDGTAYLSLGDVGGLAGVSLWIAAGDITSHTDYLLDFNGTDYITIVDGTITLNGFSGHTTKIYVDGVQNRVALADLNWHHVAVTSDHLILADDVTLGGLDGTGYYTGGVFDFRAFDYEVPP